MQKRTLNVLIIGIGYVGERHARAQLKYGSIVGIYDNDQEKAKKFAAKYNLTVFDKPETGIIWADLVHICTPDHLHTDFAAVCIKAGKNILCEKPVTTSLKDTLYLQSLVEAHKTLFFVGNNYRLTPTFLEIKERVSKGRIGKILSLHTTYLHDMRDYYKRTPWRLRQNFLYGGAVHAIDLALFISGEKVISVTAVTGRKVNSTYKMPEDYHILLTFQSGLTATVWANARVILPIHKTEVKVFGEKGTLIASNKSGVLMSYAYRHKLKEYRSETFRVGYRQTIPEEVEVVNNFILKKRKNHYPIPQLHDVINVMNVIDAAEKSIQSKKTIEIK